MLHKTLTSLKKFGLLFLIGLILGQTAIAQAQSSATTIESLAIDIWPDYDRPSVLILLTGILPPSVSLPATVTVPLPRDADVTAVARIGTDDNLYADIDYDETVPREVTLITPDARFRIEYYMPYELDGQERTFTFEWQADVVVTQMLVSVQQPIGTTEMTTDPAVFSVTPRQDGFQYHNFDPLEMQAGETFSLDVSYSRSASQLSAELLQPETPANTTTTNAQPEQPSGSGLDLNLPTILLISGGAAVLGIGLWILFGERLRRPKTAPVKVRQDPVRSRPARRREPAPEQTRKTETAEPPATSSFAQFCHQCGQKSEPGDHFCRSCGTRLKN